MCSTTSRPIRSARASGPIGWLIPNFMIVSMFSALPRPSCRAKMASLIIGIRMRFAINPGESLTSTGSLPIWRPTSKARSRAVSEVSRPRMTSRRVISATGLKKCIPMTRSGREVAPAMRVIEMEEVFVASTVPLDATRSSSLKSASLISGFSVAASMTRWASPAAAISSAITIPAAASCWFWSMIPFLASLSVDFSMACLPRSSAAGSTSVRVT